MKGDSRYTKMSKRNEVTRNGRSRRAAAIAIIIACMMTCTAFGADTVPQKSVLSATDAAAAGEQYTGEDAGNTDGSNGGTDGQTEGDAKAPTQPAGTDPTESVDPTEPTGDSSNDPTDPTQQGDPTQITDPTDPTVTTDPTKATKPAPIKKVVVVKMKRIYKLKHRYKLVAQKGLQFPIVKWTTSNKKVVAITKSTAKPRKRGKATIRGYDTKGRLCKVIYVTVMLGSDYTTFVARRGYCAHAPENTLPAFREAVRKGFTGIELDIWESKTSSKKSRPCIIVSHDKNLKHKTGKKIKAYQLNWSNRGKYKIRKNARGLKKYGPQKVPTLNEAIRCINKEAKRVGKNPNKYLIEIDVKCKLSDRAVKEVIRLVGKRPVHILSSYQSNLLKFKKYRKYRTTQCWYCSSTTSTKKRFKNIRFAGRHHYDGISIPYRYMNKKTIRLAKSYGMQIGGYNITSAAAVQKWVRAGCTRFNMRNKVFAR